jgi:hypothetical protein
LLDSLERNINTINNLEAHRHLNDNLKKAYIYIPLFSLKLRFDSQNCNTKQNLKENLKK